MDMQQMIRQVIGDKEQDNPLLIIGLTPYVLELGLSEDELYDYCKKIAQTLLVKFHPDTNKKASQAVMKRFSDAHNLLKVRKSFDVALSDFRKEFSITKQEIKRLENIISFKNKDIKELETVLKEQEKRKEVFAIKEEWMKRYLAGRSLMFNPADEIIPLYDTASVDAVAIALDFSSKLPNKSAIKEAKEICKKAITLSKKVGYRGLLQKQIDQLERIMRENNLYVASVDSLIKRALNSKKRTPAIYWNLEIAINKLKTDVSRGYILEEKHKILQTSGVNDFDVKNYKAILRCLANNLGDCDINGASIIPQKINIENSCIVNDAIKSNFIFYIIGSVALEDALSCIEKKSCIATSRPVVSNDILYKIEPFLASKRAIISMVVPQVALRKDPHRHWQSLIEERNDIVREGIKLYLSHIVL